MLKLFTDGGVIKRNPSPYGGTYAWILVEDGEEVDNCYGTIFPKKMDSIFVTNNQTELYAVIQGLKSLYDDEIADICSDSNVTLGRLFRGSPFNNIPQWMQKELARERSRLKNFNKFTYTLIGGHPTQRELEEGINEKGHPTSKWNVWCDEKCNEESMKYLESLL